MTITSARISGVSIPVNKKLFVSLTYIYGIGKKNSIVICDEVKIDPNKRVNELTEDELAILRKHISENYVVEGDLRAVISNNIKVKISIGCYCGYRHRLKLPVRGQRTKTNARTRKGKGSAVANKKKPAK
jgi:small subunit ribosomal protein S13